MLVIPKICDEGAEAALTGTKMASLETPMGFCFCPYQPNTTQWHNFISGVVAIHFGSEDPMMVTGWQRP